MDDEQLTYDFVEESAWWQIVPAYIRGVLGWHSAYVNKGIPFIVEGFYIWFGKRMPPGMVFYATHQLVEYARENNMETDAILEAQSNWLIDKM